MKKTSMSALVVGNLCLGFALIGNAATIEVLSQDIADRQPNSTFCSMTVDTTITGRASALCSSGPSVITQGPPAMTGGFGFAIASANIVSGKLRAHALGHGPILDQTTDVSATAYAEITASATVEGNGTVQALLPFDGTWVARETNSTGDLIPGGAFQILIQLAFGFQVDQFAINGSTGPHIGSIDEVLSVNVPVFDGQELGLNVFMLAQTFADGLIDFSETATLDIVPSNGVSLTYDDPRFLSNTPPPTPAIPEPSTMLLFSTGLIALMSWKYQMANK